MIDRKGKNPLSHPAQGNRVDAPDCEIVSVPVGHLNVKLATPRSCEDRDGQLTFWWGVTSASVALSALLSRGPELRGKSVIELGCGLGLAGITAGLMGARVVFTDFMDEALEYAQLNATLNGLDPERFSPRLLDWENPGDIPRFDLALGCEILYDYFFHGDLLALLSRLPKPDGRILLADRKRLAVDRFIGRLRLAGMLSVETETEVDMPNFPRQTISIFELSGCDP